MSAHNISPPPHPLPELRFGIPLQSLDRLDETAIQRLQRGAEFWQPEGGKNLVERTAASTLQI